MAREKLLIVDDTESHLSLCTRTLRRDGYEVRTATGGLSALQLLLEYSPDLVVMDLSLPDMDGWSLLARIAGIYPRLPIVLHSSYPCSGDFKSWVAEAYVAKSLDMTELERTIQDLLEARRSGPNERRARSRTSDGSGIVPRPGKSREVEQAGTASVLAGHTA